MTTAAEPSERDLREGRRQATIAGWADMDADVFAVGWAAAKTALADEPRPVSWEEAAAISTEALLDMEARRTALAEREADANDLHAVYGQPEQPAIVASTHTNPAPAASEVIAAFPQWWCRACGNRYADHAEVDGCSCGGDLTAVTVQLVAREA